MFGLKKCFFGFGAYIDQNQNSSLVTRQSDNSLPGVLTREVVPRSHKRRELKHAVNY